MQASTQARFGYLGHLSLRDAKSSNDSLRNVSALDGSAFLPNVMTLQRVSTPWQYNTPSRVLEQRVLGDNYEDDELAEASVTSPSLKKGTNSSSIRNLKDMSKTQPLPLNYVRRIRHRAQKSLHSDTVDYRTRIADLKMQADASSRSGNIYQAMQAYHSMGRVYDNEGMLQEAMQKYKQFLALSLSSKNTQGEALAYNCLGINAFKLGMYDDAIQYHNKHLELADSTGRLIAHTNLGIAFQAMGLVEHAAIHHQHAIEYANRMGAKDAQCFTVGNLGIASAAQGDLQTSRICLQYHLSAAQRLKHIGQETKFAQETLKAVSNSAHYKLGQVDASDGRIADAIYHFSEAKKAAHSKNDQQAEMQSSALMGVAKGMSDFQSYCENLLQKAASPTDTTAMKADFDDY